MNQRGYRPLDLMIMLYFSRMEPNLSLKALQVFWLIGGCCRTNGHRNGVRGSST